MVSAVIELGGLVADVAARIGAEGMAVPSLRLPHVTAATWCGIELGDPGVEIHDDGSISLLGTLQTAADLEGALGAVQQASPC